MHKFTDQTGRDWLVEIDADQLKQVRELTDIRLTGLIADECEPLFELCDDVERLVQVLWALCEEQRREKHVVTDRDFGKLFKADVITDAKMALLNAFSDFFPDPGVRGALKKYVEIKLKLRKSLTERATTDAMEQMMAIDIESESEKIYADMKANLTKSSTIATPTK